MRDLMALHSRNALLRRYTNFLRIKKKRRSPSGNQALDKYMSKECREKEIFLTQFSMAPA